MKIKPESNLSGLEMRKSLTSDQQISAYIIPVCPGSFREVFQEIKQTTDRIRPPFTETTIKQGGIGPNAGQIIYTPPRRKGIIEEKLENLISFINDDEQFNIDHLLKMSIALFQFEAIHPFRDGNGRTGRIFFKRFDFKLCEN